MSIWTYILVMSLGDISIYDDVRYRIQMLNPWALGTQIDKVATCVPYDDRTIPNVSQTGRAFIGDVAETRWGLFSLLKPRYMERGRATYT